MANPLPYKFTQTSSPAHNKGPQVKNLLAQDLLEKATKFRIKYAHKISHNNYDKISLICKSYKYPPTFTIYRYEFI